MTGSVKRKISDEKALTLSIPHSVSVAHPYRPGDEVLHLASPSMSWGVYDFNTGQALNLPASGGHFTSVPGHRYLVVMRAEDNFGLVKMTLDGAGVFEAWSEPDSNGQTFGAPSHLPASVAHGEFNGTATWSPTFQALIVVMKPDIGAWEYDRLSCGFHTYANASRREYFATSGVMTFNGTSVNAVGRDSAATLTTSPD